MWVVRTPHHSREGHFAVHFYVFYAVTHHQLPMAIGKGKAKLLEEPTVESQIDLSTFSADWKSPL